MLTRILLLTLISSIIFTFDVIEKPRTFYSIPKHEEKIADEPNIISVKQDLESNGFVLVSGEEMKKLLIQHGASDEDMAVLESGYIHKHLPIDQQPAMYHRLVRDHHTSHINPDIGQ